MTRLATGGPRMPASAVERDLENARAAAQSGLGGRVRSVIGHRRRSAGILAGEDPDELPEQRSLDDAGS